MSSIQPCHRTHPCCQYPRQAIPPQEIPSEFPHCCRLQTLQSYSLIRGGLNSALSLQMLLLSLQFFNIACIFDDFTSIAPEIPRYSSLLLYTISTAKSLILSAARPSPAISFASLQASNIHIYGIITDLINKSNSDASFWHINNSAHCQIIHFIIDGF